MKIHENNLYELRRSERLTQKEISEKIGINPQVYSKYELGKNDMSLSVARKIAETMNVSIDYIAKYSRGRKGIFEDEQEDFINKTTLQPLLENSGNKLKAMEAFLQQVKIAQQENENNIKTLENMIEEEKAKQANK